MQHQHFNSDSFFNGGVPCRLLMRNGIFVLINARDLYLHRLFKQAIVWQIKFPAFFVFAQKPVEKKTNRDGSKLEKVITGGLRV